MEAHGGAGLPHISVFIKTASYPADVAGDFNINTGYIADTVYDGNHSIYFAGEEGGYGGRSMGTLGNFQFKARKQRSPGQK